MDRFKLGAVATDGRARRQEQPDKSRCFELLLGRKPG